MIGYYYFKKLPTGSLDCGDVPPVVQRLPRKPKFDLSGRLPCQPKPGTASKKLVCHRVALVARTLEIEATDRQTPNKVLYETLLNDDKSDYQHF